MRLRLIAFLPAAALITFLLLVSTSSFVSALERSLTAPKELPPLRVSRYETECEMLYREIHALSHAATTCEAQPNCEGSPLLCPAALDATIDGEFQRLRSVLHERCDLSPGLLDYAWGGGPDGVGQTCGSAHDWLEAATRGEGEPSKFVF